MYIGENGQFKEYPYTFSEKPTPDQLIQAIADTTGWNLTLADVTTSGKGGMTYHSQKNVHCLQGHLNSKKKKFICMMQNNWTELF